MLLLLFACYCLLLNCAKSQKCELASFSLDDLSRSPWWKVTITDNYGCIFATTAGGAFTKSTCDMYFSICHPLTDITECNTNEAACQKGDFDGKSQVKDIVAYRPINESGRELNSKVGFEVVYTGQTAQTPCISNMLTLKFVCNQQAKWTSVSSGSTVPNGANTLSFAIDHSQSICEYNYTFQYNGACIAAPTIGPPQCYVDKYNYKILSTKDYWEVDMDGMQNCYRSQKCDLFFKLCDELPTSNFGNCGEHSGVCISDTQGAYYNLGKYNSTYDDLFAREDNMGFYAVYTGGNAAFLTCNTGDQLTTTLNFICNSSVFWGIDSASNKGVLPFRAEFDQTNCNVSFSFYYNGACIPASQPNGLESAPWLGIIVIILLFIFVIYWVAGFIINVVLGKRGEDVIPNRAFWYGGVKLFWGGFVFIYRLLTGKRPSESSGYEGDEEKEPIAKPKGYQSIEDSEKGPFGP